MRQPFPVAISCHARKKLGNLNMLYIKTKNPVGRNYVSFIEIKDLIKNRTELKLLITTPKYKNPFLPDNTNNTR